MAQPLARPRVFVRGLRDPAAPRFGLLLTAEVVSIAVQGVSSPSGLQRVVVTALSGAAMVLALRAARVGAVTLRLAAGAVALALAASVLGATTGDVSDGATRTMNAGLLVIGPPAVAVGVMRDLRSTGRVRLAAVLGVLALYLLLGMVFASVFGAIDRLGGGPIFADGVAASVSQCIYYSFTTLATVGFGDVVTRTQLGHTLSIFEALIGQIYLVTVVSLLVGNLAPHRAPEP